jgi:hypothetical protein
MTHLSLDGQTANYEQTPNHVRIKGMKNEPGRNLDTSGKNEKEGCSMRALPSSFEKIFLLWCMSYVTIYVGLCHKNIEKSTMRSIAISCRS